MKPSIKSLMIIVIIITIAVIGAIFFFHSNPRLPKPISINTKNQPTTGNSNAKIHIIAFEDLKCHNCMRYNVEVYPKVDKKYIKTGKATYTVINVAFIEGSMPAANAARCVYAQNKKLFFPYVKAIYNNQPPEGKNWTTISNLVKFAKNIPGINKQTLSRCIYKSPYTNFINNNLKIGMKAMNGVVATPTLYVNGYIVKPLTISRIDEIVKAIK